MDAPGGAGADDLAAGDFSSWLVELEGARRGERDTEVPCGTCTACCTSSQFVHIAPDETDTLAHIPSELVFPAPRWPPGHVVMGYDQRGHCPMLRDGSCSIYDHRPRTCRIYDCRVFAAADVSLDDSEQHLIAERSRRWRFSFSTDTARAQQAAVRAAAAFVREHRRDLPADALPATTTQLAVLAVELHRTFLGRGSDGDPFLVDPGIDAVRVELTRRSVPR